MVTRVTDRPDPGHRRWLNQQAPRWLQPLSIGLALFESAAVIGQAALIAWSIHAVVILQQAVGDLWSTLTALLLVFVLRMLIQAGRGLLSARASSSVRHRLRKQLFDRISAAGPGPLRKLGTGELMTRLVDQSEAVDAYFARFLPQLSSAVLIPLVIVMAVASQNWLAGLLLALTAPIIPLFMALVGMGAEQLGQRQQQAMGQLAGVFHDRLRGLDTIRRFCAEQRERERLESFSDQLRQRTMGVLRLAFLSSAVLEFFAAVAIASLAIYIGLGLLGYISFGPTASLTLGSGLFILLLAPEFFQPLRTLAQAWHDRADGLAAAARLRPLLELAPARPEPRQPVIQIPQRACSVQARGLGFSWPGRGPVLVDLDLDVAAGEHLVIAGPSGCGKSTLISLLAGFMAPDRGRILFDGMDQANFDQSALARCRAWLGQTPVLFAGTVAENIVMDRPNIDQPTLLNAADMAEVSAFCADLPLGLDTPVGQDGRGFSGGQAQRIALARTLLLPRPILLLDEPTAGLDQDSEQRIWAAIERITRQRSMTVICTSHSQQAQHWADRVLQMDQGRLTPIVR